jgi:hypothetical protein
VSMKRSRRMRERAAMGSDCTTNRILRFLALVSSQVACGGAYSDGGAGLLDGNEPTANRATVTTEGTQAS